MSAAPAESSSQQDAAAQQEQQPQQEQPQQPREAKIQTFANDHLLKIETHDRFSTASKIKQHIAKQLPPTAYNALTQAPPAPLFPGLNRVGKNPSQSVMFMNFESDEAKTAARDALVVGVKYKGRSYAELPVTKGDLAVQHRGGSRRDRAAEDASSSGSGSRGDNKEPFLPGPSVAPWRSLRYEQQLERKAEHCKKVLRVIAGYHSRTSGPGAAATVQALKDGSLFRGVVPSPVRCGYRNNVQVTAGYTRDGKETFGFNAGAIVEGKADLLDVSEGAATSHPAVTPLTELFMEKIAKPLRAKHGALLQSYDKNTASGFWRRIQLRFSGANPECDAMLDVEVCDTGVPPAVLQEVRTAITDVFSQLGPMRVPVFEIDVVEVAPTPTPATAAAAASADGETAEASSPGEQKNGDDDDQPKTTAVLRPASGDGGNKCSTLTVNVRSVQLHLNNGVSNVGDSDAPREVLFGAPTITDRLFGLHFDIAPADFFQVNLPAMELLLDGIRSAATLSKETTTLLDLCSGTGTLGLAFAGSVKKVIGVELIATAVANANKNAARNGVDNALFLCGKVEEVLPRVVRSMTPGDLRDVVAILDPPRCGVHASVLKALRNIPGLSTIVYISCEQKALEANCEPLTKDASKQFHGVPFQVASAFGVDLFPHTRHVEMIAVLKRPTVAAANATATAATAAAAAATSTEAVKPDAAAGADGDDEGDA